MSVFILLFWVIRSENIAVLSFKTLNGFQFGRLNLCIKPPDKSLLFGHVFVQFVHLIDKEVLSSQKTRTPVKTIKSSSSLSSLTTPPTLVQCPPLFHLSISYPYPPLLPSLTNFITKLFPLTSHPPKSPRHSYHTLMSLISFHPLPLPCYPS